MIIDKHKIKEQANVVSVSDTPSDASTSTQEVYTSNAMTEAYLAVRTILSELLLDENNPDKGPLFRTIKLDNGQLSRVKKARLNEEYGIAFPAVFIHFINVYYNVGQSKIHEGKGTMRIHYVLNRLNNSDDHCESEGFEIFQRINAAIQARKADFPALVSRFQLAYWDQPLSFDDGLQPFWIDYDIWFKEFSSYRYKDYVDCYVVIPPFTDHSDQLPESNPNNHENHNSPTADDAIGLLE